MWLQCRMHSEGEQWEATLEAEYALPAFRVLWSAGASSMGVSPGVEPWGVVFWGSETNRVDRGAGGAGMEHTCRGSMAGPRTAVEQLCRGNVVRPDGTKQEIARVDLAGCRLPFAAAVPRVLYVELGEGAVHLQKLNPLRRLQLWRVPLGELRGAPGRVWKLWYTCKELREKCSCALNLLQGTDARGAREGQAGAA